MMDDSWEMIALRLGMATLIGAILGLEREWRGHDAGIRTHALVALSSAMTIMSAILLAEDIWDHGGDSDPVRVVQGLAQAIGFIAGGLIFVRAGDVRNMTTATSLWMAATIGIGAGAGQFKLVLVGSAAALVVLSASALLERFRPEKSSDAQDEDISMPNRRGGKGS